MKLETYIESVYLPEKRKNLAPSTLAGYESDLRNHVIPRWGDVEMEDIRAADIQWWLGGMTHAVAVNSKGALQRVLRLAERDDLIVFDPCRKAITLPKRRVPYTPRWLETRQVRELARGFWGHPLEAYVCVSVMCGLRRCEAAALNWSDIDLREGRVHIDKGLQHINGEDVEWFTKTASSVRDVYLPMTAVRRLREIKSTGPVCAEPDGSRMNPDKVARHYRAHCRREGLPYVPPMYLRHTYVHMAIEAGIPEAVIKEQLEHTESSQMLRQNYFWSGKSISKNAAKALNCLLLE